MSVGFYVWVGGEPVFSDGAKEIQGKENYEWVDCSGGLHGWSLRRGGGEEKGVLVNLFQ